ncbi:MAG TPA: leucine--tRNA ligase [archaeon]|nr:leucine--tRNA ligase [archaeon]
MPVDLVQVAKKWQKKWEKEGVFESKFDPKKKKYYCLEMFPYPSGKLHMGHVRNYSIGDCIARFRRMQGYNVLYPMGFDSFGLPAENAAIENKSDPKEWTLKRIEDMEKQLHDLGFSYDWGREIITCKPEYYKWNQYFFLKMLQKGLAYKKASKVNWCEKCHTVLANEQVVEGKCWRHKDVTVVQKDLEQWFLKITHYADELLDGLEDLKGWPERVRTMQKNWIGKSFGVNIFFKLENSKTLPAFTTRCDTIYSVTFLAIAPESPLVAELVAGTQYEKGAFEFVEKVKQENLIDRMNEEKAKEGFFVGKYAINPVNGEKIPIYIANFALMYGSGIVMCDAHDKRDFKFARKYNIPLKFVISKDGKELDASKAKEAFVDDGILFNSGEFSGLGNKDVLPKMSTWLEKEGFGEKTTNYRLRDWLISRQRFWGTPIPIIYCDKCGTVAVPEKDLPIELPDPKKADFTGKGNPLSTVKEFVKVKCPKCKSDARRETDTMDTFVDSSWYFLRFCSPGEKDQAFDKKQVKYWMPVNQYIGGIEHAILHLLYARFFTRFLKDEGLVSFSEPFERLLSQGLVIKDGAKMSKSLGNVVEPGPIVEKFGADTVRVFMLSSAAPEKEIDWSDKGVEGSYRNLLRVHSLFEASSKKFAFGKIPSKLSTSDKLVLSKTHSTIKKVSQDIEEYKFNYAINSIFSLVNTIQKHENLEKNVLGSSLIAISKMLSPFAAHLSEELWEMLGKKGFISIEKWPTYDQKMIDEGSEAIEEIIEKIKSDVVQIKQLAKIEHPKKISIYIAPKWKWDAMEKVLGSMEKPDFSAAMRIAMSFDAAKKNPKAVQGFVKSIVDKFHELKGVKRIDELSLLLGSSEILQKELGGCEVEILDAQKVESEKAQRAFPLKPAILVQ